MAANMTGMQSEGTAVVGMRERRNGSRTPRTVACGLVAALAVVLLIGGVALHQRGAAHPAAVTIPRTTGAQTRFLENNTTNLPNAASGPAAISGVQQRFVERNTTDLPMAVGAAVMTSAQQRFLEINTTRTVGVSSPAYGEDLTPLPGHPR